MTKYICVRKMDFSPKEYEVGDIVEINKLDEPITERYEFEDLTFSAELHYEIVDTGFRLQDNTLKRFFRKVQPKDTIRKRILKTLLILFMYELSKYVTNEIIIKLQANYDIDQPKDYEDLHRYTYSYQTVLRMTK